MAAKVDMSGFKKKMKNLASMSDNIIKPAYDFFVANTPVKTGNARRQTKIKNKSIEADYRYAQKLDEGSSKQSPKGMTKPTEKYIDKLVNDYIKKIGK